MRFFWIPFFYACALVDAAGSDCAATTGSSLIAMKSIRRKSEDASTEDSYGSSARDLYIHHASRVAQHAQTKEWAAHMLQTMKDEEKNNVFVQDNVEGEELETRSPPNRTAYHANKTKHHAKVIENATACRACGVAEQELIVVTETARVAHATAQSAAEFLGHAEHNYALALQGFIAANQAYNQAANRAANQLCPITLAYDAAQSSFDAYATAAQDLSQKAHIAQQWKVHEVANKTIADSAQTQYDTAAAAATIAEQPVAAKKAAEKAACGAFGLAPPTPAPPPPPTPTLDDADARYKCCLANGVVRVVYPAGSINAPASSISLLIAKQKDYNVKYLVVAIGEQDGAGPRMKAGTIKTFNNGAEVGPVTQDTWTEKLFYNIEPGKNYIIAYFVKVGPDGWTEWDDQGKTTFMKKWQQKEDTTAPDWVPESTNNGKVWNIKAIEAH